MKKYAEAFYKGAEWERVREIKYKQAKGVCEECLKNGAITPGEIVHHVTHITKDNITDDSITLNLSNLVLLCRECHGNAHRKNMKRRYKVDAVGRVIELG